MRINQFFGSLAVLCAFALVSCDRSIPTETAPDDPLASKGEQGLLSDDSKPSIEELIALYEEVAADPQLRERWAFGGTDGPMSVDEVLDALRAARAAAPHSVAPSSFQQCRLIGNSAVGPTGGAPPGSRDIVAYGVTVIEYGCGSANSIGLEGTVDLEDEATGNHVHSGTLYDNNLNSSFSTDQHSYRYSGPALRGFVDSRHWATGYFDEYSGASGSGM